MAPATGTDHIIVVATRHPFTGSILWDKSRHILQPLQAPVCA